MIRKAVFVIFPIPSHYLSCFPLAKALQDTNYEIIFLGHAWAKEMVENEGFKFKNFSYKEVYQLKSIRAFFGLLLLSLFETRSLLSRYREWYSSVFQILLIDKELNPTCYFVDEHLNHYFIPLHSTRKGVIIVNTKLSTKRQPYVPPLNSYFIPHKTIVAKIYCDLLWLRHILNYRFDEIPPTLALLGKSDSFFYKRLCKKIGLNWHSTISNNNAFYPAIKGVKTIVLAPRVLEFKVSRPCENEIYINWPPLKNESKFITISYLDLKVKLVALRAQGFKVIFFAMGTTSRGYFTLVQTLLNKVTKVVCGHLDWLIVISTSGVKYDLPNSERIFTFDILPQLDLLQLTDAMINHGGLTTVKECLHYKVPMLIFPMNQRSDQKGNAARVESNGFGLSGKINKDSVREVEEKLVKVLDMKINIGDELYFASEINGFIDSLQIKC